MRKLKFYQAIHEAIDLCLARDRSVYLMGLGVPDPKGIFGSTLGLQEKYGPTRVMDMPTSENAMTGVAVGSALVGMRPILTHQRVDFSLLAMDPIVNQAAKWHYMFGGQMKVPLVIRMIIGRGWGQGPQHAQSLQSWFAHIPGLKVVMPSTAYDAKGLLISSIEDNNPVIFMEHRWLYNVEDEVPEGWYQVRIGEPRVVREGRDVTIVTTSLMTLEALRAHEILLEEGIQTEVIDVRTLKPLEDSLILKSVRKTGRLLVADTGWNFCGFAAEVMARVAETAINYLKAAPVRLTLQEAPTPTAYSLSGAYYPTTVQIVEAVRKMLDTAATKKPASIVESLKSDVPDSSFTGPF